MTNKNDTYESRYILGHCRSLQNGEISVNGDVSHDNFTRVYIWWKWNLKDSEENYLCEECYDWIRFFQGHFALVKNEGKWNLINKKGKLVLPLWFDRINFWYENDGDQLLPKEMAWISLNGKKLYIDKNGNLHKSIF